MVNVASVRRRASLLAILALSVLGMVLFAWPLLGLGDPGAAAGVGVAAGAAAVLMAIEVGLRRLDSRALALLASLSAIDAGARAALVTGIGGFSPIFLLILCGGYAFGPSFGFLLGATSLLVSALATGGLGPWLPYQMFAVGWVGLAAGVVGVIRRRRRTRMGRATWGDVLVLAATGAVTGYLFGAVMDLWQWTFYRSSPGLGFTPGMSSASALQHFAHFYVATSAVYDSFRAGGNAVLVLAIGLPVLVSLGRLRHRRQVEIVPAPAAPSTGARRAGPIAGA
ncbi:MAG: ECF transporter S component [Acidimicrobiales bacterium]